ncbi:MAG: hypothetical protein IJO65_05415 [Lachnospiraceae bacterium]|nr:hypothetical protein [Lachnospiraceae bacterium]
MSEDNIVAEFVEKHRKKIFFMILTVAIGMIYAYNLLTPYFSDDYMYAFQARQAESLWDLVKQQYAEYLSNSGRIIGQFNIRLFLSVDKHVFNVVNSFMFGALVLLMYANVRRKNKYDIFSLLLIIVFLWRYAVDFGQTMLWICGSCNYLWGSVFILGFVTLYRFLLENNHKIKRHALVAVGVFFFGVLAGWCNENTSGGGLMLVLMFAANFVWDRKKEGKKCLFPFMISGVAGMCCGLLGMLTAPGVRGRSSMLAEGDEYTGFVGILSRIYKTSVTVREHFFELLVLLIIVFVLLALQKKLNDWKQIRTNESVLFLVAAAATAYVLVIISTTADRAFFGAGIFLMIAVIRGISEVDADKELLLKTAKYSLVGILCLWLFFTYMENLVNVARIYREETERVEMIKADKADPNGDGIVIVPLLREEFANPYSVAHVSDMTDDKNYWINIFYELYYDVGNITAIPRDEWEVLYGDTFGQPK